MKDAVFDEDIFDWSKPEQPIAVIWWLVHLLGDKVYIPVDEKFWLENFPEDTRLAMRVEGGKLVLCAEKLTWT